MAENAEKLTLFEKIRVFFRGVRAEYSKIIFPNQETLKKQTVAVIVASVFLGLLIFILDIILKYLLGLVL